MRFNYKAILIGSLLMGTALPTVAATFRVPISYKIMFVDLKPASDFGGDFKVDVKPGKHQFVIRYHQILSQGQDDSIYQSQPIIVNVTVAKDSVLRVKAPSFHSKWSASNYAKKPTFTIENEDGTKINFKSKMLPLRPGFQLGRDYRKEVQALNNGTYEQQFSEDQGSGPNAAPEATDATAFTMMKFWYNKAKQPTRKHFRIWAIDQSMDAKDDSTTAYKMLKFWYNKSNKAQQKAIQVWLLK